MQPTTPQYCPTGNKTGLNIMYKIYSYTNTIDGKVYFGQTNRTLEERAGNNGIQY